MVLIQTHHSAIHNPAIHSHIVHKFVPSLVHPVQLALLEVEVVLLAHLDLVVLVLLAIVPLDQLVQLV
jgi:hypothetical protein